jgi:DNA-directed RNA polymerase subunit M/transcription elongation factor TFIIS
MEISYFTPGEPILPGPPLAPYRPTTPGGALAPYLEAYTQPGDLVIDLFCQGSALIHETVRAGRRALGLNVNRALLLAASVGLTDVERRQVEAAFTRLANARKGTQTLQEHVQGLYRTTCPACGAATVAEALIWARDEDAPVAKRYHCTGCDDAGTAPANEADRTAAHFEPRGLSYWLLLDRAAPADAPYRERMAALLDLYTPRNLSALNDLLLKSDALELSLPVRRTLDALLLDTLDQATSLRPPDAPLSRPRRPRRPARYVEANVWQLFEHALQTWRETTLLPTPRAPTLDALLSHTPNLPISTHLLPLSARQAGRDLPPACAALIVADPPRPDLTLWRLTALWSHWLWGRAAGAPLAPFLDRRWLSHDKFWRGVRGALRAVAPLLRPGGRLVALFADEDPTVLESLALAAAGAGYELTGWGARLPEMRLVWRVGAKTRSPPVEADRLSRAVAERAADASLEALRARGTPTTWPVLHSAIYADLAESGLLAHAAALPEDVESLALLSGSIRSALDGAPLRQISSSPARGQTETHFWWLDQALESEAAAPLSDRVELAVAHILRDVLAVSEAELQRRVCAHFPGPQTPSAHLVRLCLFSYGDEHAPGHWRLRVEDDFEARVAETDAVIADLADLGRRLGFDARLGIPSAGEWAVCWLDEAGRTSYAFAVRTTAVLGDLSHSLPLEPDTTPCLALPGGRAVLVSYKLRRDPRLRQQVARHDWQFLKFRHLRHLVREVAHQQLDRHAFRAALGLDPIVEQTQAQMSLW